MSLGQSGSMKTRNRISTLSKISTSADHPGSLSLHILPSLVALSLVLVYSFRLLDAWSFLGSSGPMLESLLCEKMGIVSV